MIGLVFAGIGILLAYNIGAWYTESKYERIIKEKETSYAQTLGAMSDLMQELKDKESEGE